MSKLNTNFAGMNGFIWWVGKVVGTGDPLQLGRVRVKILGWHTTDPNDKSAGIADTDCPWAHPVHPVTTGSLSGSKLKEGDWVVGFFADGESGQFPLVFGYLPGIAVDKY